MKKFAIASVIIFVFGFVLGVIIDRQMTADDPQEPQVHTDTITYIDTIPFYQPIPVDSVVLRYKTITDTIHIQVNGQDTTIVADYDIPITQKEYSDTTYHAWVSGYEPSLDSIYVFPRYQQITTTITQTKYKNKHWGLGINTGLGYTANKFQPYIGIGIQYNIFLW